MGIRCFTSVYSFADNPKVFLRPPGRVYGSMVMLHAQVCCSSVRVNRHQQTTFLFGTIRKTGDRLRSNSKEAAKIILFKRSVSFLPHRFEANFRVYSGNIVDIQVTCYCAILRSLTPNVLS